MDKIGENRKPEHGKRKRRLDVVLVERGFFSSRTRAAAAIMAGLVQVEGQAGPKAGTRVAPDADIVVTEREGRVSRGGLKLERAFEVFPFDVAGKVALDAGASAGGFTECLLRHGAAEVIAVDVGYGQLDWKLRQDPRVYVLERTNVRYLEPGQLPLVPDVATLDLSFISLKKVLPAVIRCLRAGFEIVVLVKPQFEAGREKVGKGGVVRDISVHREVLDGIWEFAEAADCGVKGVTDSGVPGPKGNIEYLMYLVETARPGTSLDRKATLDGLMARVKANLLREEA